MSFLRVENHFASTGGGEQTKDLVVPAGKTFVLRAIDFAGPVGPSAMKLVRDPGGDDEILSAANGDKYIGQMPPYYITGPDTIRCSLQKTGGGPAVLMGIVLYYEELG